MGTPKTQPSPNKSGQFKVIVPVNLRISDTLIPAVSNVVLNLNGTIRPGVFIERDGGIRGMLRVGSENVLSAKGTLVRLASDYETSAYFQGLMRRSALQLRFSNSLGDTNVCKVHLLGDVILGGAYNNRLFPIIKITSQSKDRFGVDFAGELKRAQMGKGIFLEFKDPNGAIRKEFRPSSYEEIQESIDDTYRNEPGAGFVMILHDPVQFQVGLYLPEEVVRDLKEISAHILQARTEDEDSREFSICSIVGPD